MSARGRKTAIRTLRAVSLAALIPAAMLSAPGGASAESIDGGHAEDERLCELPPGADSRALAASRTTATGRFDLPWYATWLGPARVQEGLQAVDAAVEGNADVIGTLVDYEKQALLVVVFPNADRAKVQDVVADAAGGRVRTETRVGCRSPEAVSAAKRSVEAAARALGISRTDSTVDVATTKLKVVVPAKTSEAASAELRSAADVLEVLTLTPFGRWDDGSPHYGGAGIVPDGYTGTRVNNNVCTSGLPVDWNGARYFSSAAHCRAAGGPYWLSGPVYYGAERQVNSTADSMLLGSSNQTYTRKIHTTPCDPSACSRTITSKITAVEGTPVCISGMVTEAICGAITEGTVTVNGITYRVARKSGTIIGRKGDSGGPLYGRTGDFDASARGMLLGGVGPESESDDIYYMTVPQLEFYTGGTVATTG